MTVAPPWIAAPPRSHEVEGLRARKKRHQRRQLSDTATWLFLERGFEGVRVADIAQACDVSEATVFNYFPTKESLILDRLDGSVLEFLQAVGDLDRDPVDAAVDVLSRQLDQLFIESAPDGDGDGERTTLDGIHRFGSLIRSTASLRAHLSDRKDACTRSAAAALAERYRLDAYDPRLIMAATALVGLWQLQSDSQFRATGTETSWKAVSRRVRSDLGAGATLISRGLDTLSSGSGATQR